MPTLTAHAIDTNHRACSAMAIKAEFDAEGPVLVRHDGRTFFRTGKKGIDAGTGELTLEMADAADARLWISLDGRRIWED